MIYASHLHQIAQYCLTFLLNLWKSKFVWNARLQPQKLPVARLARAILRIQTKSSVITLNYGESTLCLYNKIYCCRSASDPTRQLGSVRNPWTRLVPTWLPQWSWSYPSVRRPCHPYSMLPRVAAGWEIVGEDVLGKVTFASWI